MSRLQMIASYVMLLALSALMTSSEAFIDSSSSDELDKDTRVEMENYMASLLGNRKLSRYILYLYGSIIVFISSFQT
jgi:hypothetical protein